MPSPTARVAIFAFVLALHLTVLLLARLEMVARRRAQSPMAVIGIWIRPALSPALTTTTSRLKPGQLPARAMKRLVARPVIATPVALPDVPQFSALATQPTSAIDWSLSRQLAIAQNLAKQQRKPTGYHNDGSGRLPEHPAAPPREPQFAWSREPRYLLRKNRVANVSIDGAGLLIHLGKDRCIIANLVAFGCRIGREASANGALFDDMRAHLDARATDPLP